MFKFLIFLKRFIKNKKQIRYNKLEFLELLKFKIKEAVPYTYPESKCEFIPNFSRPVYIEKSSKINNKEYINAIKKLEQSFNLEGLKFTYNNLTDEYSKEIFIDVIIYSLFSGVKKRYPLYYSNKWNDFPKNTFIKNVEEFKKLSGEDFKIVDMNKYGYDFKLFTKCLSLCMLVSNQYSYKNQIYIKKNDYVIDGGACYGDTAIQFSEKVGENGRIYSFEFVNENLKIFDKNLELNPKLAKNIKYIKNALSENSDEEFWINEKAEGSYISKKSIEKVSKIESISIDDFVKQNKIKKIDFIKLDIEGSELATLKGAINTIKTFKPKLAISIYHKREDLWEIPKLIKEILPEYELYIDQHTIMSWETVLYAKIAEVIK